MEIGNPVILIDSKRNNQLAVVGYHKYRRAGQRSSDGLLKWRCSVVKNCCAHIYTGPDKSTVRDASGVHVGGDSHPKQDITKVIMQMLRENCKRAAAQSNGSLSAQTVRDEMEKLSRQYPWVVLHFGACYKSVRKSLYDKRSPQRRPDAAAARDEQNADRPRTADVRRGTWSVCATTEANLSFLRHYCTELYAETAYACAPKNYSLVYILHGVCPGGEYVPLVYFVLADRARETLENAWAYLQHLTVERCGGPFRLRTLHVDFATAAHEAVRAVFPDARVQGRVFDVTPMWMEKIESDETLSRAYYDADCPLGSWLRKMFDLKLVPSNKVSDGFVQLMESCPNISVGTKFSDFILENFIDDDSCTYPPDIWAEEPRPNPTKTKGPTFFESPFSSVSLEVFQSEVLLSKLKEAGKRITQIIKDWNSN